MNGSHAEENVPPSILFDVRELYYLPQYLPVFRELARRGAVCQFVFYQNPDFDSLLRAVAKQEELDVVWVAGEGEALAHYQICSPSWILFGNSFSGAKELPEGTRTAQLGHGVGPKMSYYTKSSTAMDARFVEGDRRLQILREMYPQGNFVQTGFAKLDPLVNGETAPFDLVAQGLDPAKKTILYAPTFYPSSLELFADNWPQAFADYNLLVKPHFFSLSKARYAAQRKKLDHWQKADNLYVAGMEEHSLLPFLAAADLLISEASSSLFEFAALGKPIVWCDFLKLRWTYRGPLRFRFTRRMDQDIKNYHDLGAHAARYRDLLSVVRQQIENPRMYAANRERITAQLVGTVDGKASERVADYLLSH